jgi:hypothetical protein
LKNIKNYTGVFAVEVACRFVAHYYQWVVDEGTGNGDLYFLKKLSYKFVLKKLLWLFLMNQRH